MIQAPKSGYIKALCIETRYFKDSVWGDCTVLKGGWYEVIDNDDYLLVRFDTGLCPHEAKLFKTEAQIREAKINQILMTRLALNRNNEENNTSPKH